MKVIKRITSYDVDPTVDFFILMDGDVIIYAVKEHLFETRLGEHEHPMEITKAEWVFFDVQPFERWVFKRANENKEQFIILKEAARMSVSELS